MADDRGLLALCHILDAIDDFLQVVGTLDASQLANDRVRLRAAERCVQIISEASRRIPEEWKAKHPSVAWRDAAGIGNILRHNRAR